jgi:hypothetical protein
LINGRDPFGFQYVDSNAEYHADRPSMISRFISMTAFAKPSITALAMIE